jgi:hypothetical protein
MTEQNELGLSPSAELNAATERWRRAADAAHDALMIVAQWELGDPWPDTKLGINDEHRAWRRRKDAKEAEADLQGAQERSRAAYAEMKRLAQT